MSVDLSVGTRRGSPLPLGYFVYTINKIAVMGHGFIVQNSCSQPSFWAKLRRNRNKRRGNRDSLSHRDSYWGRYGFYEERCNSVMSLYIGGVATVLNLFI